MYSQCQDNELKIFVSFCVCVSSVPAVLVHVYPMGMRPSTDSICPVFPEPSTENRINSWSARVLVI